jgi:cyanate permease
MNDAPEKTYWPIVVAATLAGVAAGLEVGKVPPSLLFIRDDLGVSMVTAGWIASVFNLVSATLAIASGLLADRVGARRVVIAGLGLLVAGALIGAFTDSGLALIGARTVAGAGLVTIAVAAPRIIVSAAAPSDYGLVLGFWSIYMPGGMALAMVSAAPILELFGWRALWLIHAAVLVGFLALFIYTTRPGRWSGEGPNQKHTWADVMQVLKLPGPWLMAGIFACYALQFFAMMSWLPTFLVESQGMAATTAALYAALAVAANMIGNLGGAWAMHHGFRRHQLQITALVVMAICAVGVFSNLIGPDLKVPLAFLFSAAGGLLPAAVLAGSAFHAPSRAQVATVNGVIVQGANTGSLSGPPLMAMVVALSGGWLNAWWLLVICAAVGIALALLLGRVERSIDDKKK